MTDTTTHYTVKVSGGEVHKAVKNYLKDDKQLQLIIADILTKFLDNNLKSLVSQHVSNQLNSYHLAHEMKTCVKDILKEALVSEIRNMPEVSLKDKILINLGLK